MYFCPLWRAERGGIEAQMHCGIQQEKSNSITEPGLERLATSLPQFQRQKNKTKQRKFKNKQYMDTFTLRGSLHVEQRKKISG